MDLLDFFNLSKKLEKVIVPGGVSQSKRRPRPTQPVEDSEPEDEKDYVKEYQLKEEEELTKNFTLDDFNDKSENKPTSSGMMDVEDLTIASHFPNVNDIENDDIHDRYSFAYNSTVDLPINVYKDKIVSMIDTNPVTIIQGFTGCGKTTQVPQYILDAHVNRHAYCNIIVTQPRRLAAISIAERVSNERQWELGSLVGYQVGFNNLTSLDTRLTYCTTGVLLQKLIFKRDMNQYTHVILDEVHERDQDMDFVLMVVRKLQRTNSRTVKVILMSATFDVSRFSQYFSMPVASKLEPAPIISVEQERKYTVTECFMDQLGELGPIPDTKVEEPGISDNAYQIATRLIKIFDMIEEKQFEASKPQPNAKRALAFKGSVLVFLPGINEIETLFKMLLEEQESLSLKGKKFNWWVLPLHSSITSEEQVNVFKPARPAHRKIILSTNIAESSITVPDIKFVIDFCLTKQLVVDSQTSFSSLQTTWASKTNCIQRSGRVGRVCDGSVYRMVKKDFYHMHLKDDNLPEILRCPLDRLVLQTKLLNMGEPKALLALSLDPPDLTHLKNTILKLKETGALLMKAEGKVTPHDGDITYLGRVMARLPVDIHISKLIVFGHIFNVLEECIIMGAAMSTKSVFSAPFQERLKAYHSKLTWANSSCSDCVAFMNAYKLWRSSKMSGFFNRMVGDNENGWAKRHFIQLKPMYEVDAMVRDLKQRLVQIGIEEPTGDVHTPVPEEERPLIFKVVIAGAFYPNYFVRGAQGGQVNEREAVKQLLGRDPFTTVFLQGMPHNQPGELYVKSIRKALMGCGDKLRITFEASSKVFVQFPRTQNPVNRPDMGYVANIPGKVAMAVYRAIKLRQLRIPIVVHFLPPHEAARRAEKLGISNRTLFDKPAQMMSGFKHGVDRQVPLPCIDETIIFIQISHLIDPGHFWAQHADDYTCGQLQRLIVMLNGSDSLLPNAVRHPPMLLPLSEPPQMGRVYAAPFTDTVTWYYRARVISITPGPSDSIKSVQVFFVDYGNTFQLSPSELRDFPPQLLHEGILEIESQAFECVLSEVQPSILKNTRGIWSDKFQAGFQETVCGKVLYGKVYSVVHGVISVELLESPTDTKSINQKIIESGFGERAEESYLSKVNHDIRLQQDELEPEQKKAYDNQQAKELEESAYYPSKEIDPPSLKECRTSEQLRGPFSPLEMKLFHLIKAGMSKEVMIEWNSVNSVLLDTEPHDPHDRLLVAASVGQNPTGGRLTLRHTTLMPNIHGLPALIALIFAPTVELRTNTEKTKLTGALCGLGCNPDTSASLFPDHDMEITFDSEITVEDISNINMLRYWINFALHTTSEEELPDNGPKDVKKYQDKAKSFLFQILGKRRRSQELHLNTNSMQWGLIDPSDLIDPGTTPLDPRAPFRLHWGVKLELKSEPDEATRQQLEHVKELRKIAAENGPFRETSCNLCGVPLLSTLELRLHLESARHKDLEEDLVYDC